MRAGWARNLARWRHLGNVPRVRRVQLDTIRRRGLLFLEGSLGTARCSTDKMQRYIHSTGMVKAFLPFEEARELVRGIGLESQEVREPSPEQSRKKRSGD